MLFLAPSLKSWQTYRKYQRDRLYYTSKMGNKAMTDSQLSQNGQKLSTQEQERICMCNHMNNVIHIPATSLKLTNISLKCDKHSSAPSQGREEEEER